MSRPEACIVATGIVSALGAGIEETLAALERGESRLQGLTHFKPAGPILPVGQVDIPLESASSLPRTHRLARRAADQIRSSTCDVPDAVVLGGTTGGMGTTEMLIRDGVADPERYGYHSVASVAEDLARRFGCRGPVISVSTACSSGAVAIHLALALIRAGWARRVLTGGVDAICRLTYYGFKSLQLLAPEGARPLDRDRRGMSLAEGAGLLMLEAGNPSQAGIAVLGSGLSCDAHHPVQPHPEGRGALSAMQAALADAGLDADRIDAVSLHGTGTPDNDLAEALAVGALFDPVPPASSLKGAMGHTLAAAGALEAVIAAGCIERGLIPANIGCRHPDPGLGLKPVQRPVHTNVNTVLSNSFGFGGNNAAVVIGRGGGTRGARSHRGSPALRISGWAGLSGAGDLAATLRRFDQGSASRGRVPAEDLDVGSASIDTRRLKRLPRMALVLAAEARRHSGARDGLQAVFCGTGWGALSETWDFLARLQATGERFASPTDFIGSVHNAAAGCVALEHQARGANVTTTGGDYSFEQSLLAAQLTAPDDRPSLVMAVDEAHPRLTVRIDPAAGGRFEELSDGGGALWIDRASPQGFPRIRLRFFERALDDRQAVEAAVRQLDAAAASERYGLILVGIPAGRRLQGARQLQYFRDRIAFDGPLVDYRPLLGEFPSVSALAAALAAALVSRSEKVFAPVPDRHGSLEGRGVLLMGLGDFITATEIIPA